MKKLMPLLAMGMMGMSSYGMESDEKEQKPEIVDAANTMAWDFSNRLAGEINCEVYSPEKKACSNGMGLGTRDHIKVINLYDENSGQVLIIDKSSSQYSKKGRLQRVDTGYCARDFMRRPYGVSINFSASETSDTGEVSTSETWHYSCGGGGGMQCHKVYVFENSKARDNNIRKEEVVDRDEAESAMAEVCGIVEWVARKIRAR